MWVQAVSDGGDVFEFNVDAISVVQCSQLNTVAALGRYEIIRLFGVYARLR